MDHSRSPELEPAHHKPRLARLLSALRLDVEYVRGEGAVLYAAAAPSCEGGWRPAEVVDFVGGFGTLLLGHSPPPLVAHARQLLDCGLPMQTQGARSRPAELLARALTERCGGGYVCVFGNSGAEAVEAALKHALLETGGRTFITVERGFHGKTLGALQTIGNPQYLSPFALDGLVARRVAANDSGELDAAFGAVAGTGRLAGMVVEPILGEGGVRPLSDEFLRSARRKCDEHRVPLIVDECQTGCGRTGVWLACEAAGIRPDYIVLSKALGGGLAKVAATLIARSRYREEFDWKHTSTFAADNHSCSIALRTLELIDDELLLRVRRRGALLRDGLQAIQSQFPDVIAEVRGRGLMLGVEFVPPRESTSFVFRVLTSQDELLFLVAGYLLAKHRVRVLPTLSDPWTLRLQPPACVTEEQCARMLDGLRDVCEIVRDGRLGTLARFLESERGDIEVEHAPARDASVGGEAGDAPLDRASLDRAPLAERRAAARRVPSRRAALRDGWRLCAFDSRSFERDQRKVPTRRVAWLCHMVDIDDLTLQDSSLRLISLEGRERLLDSLAPLATPIVMSGVDVRSLTGELVRLYPIMLPFTSRMAREWLDARQFELCHELIRGGLAIASELGCSLASLGQYTSILSGAGAGLRGVGIRLTSGNSYTVALAVEAVERAMEARGVDPARSTLAIAGAVGNIGSICAEILASRFERTVLLSRERPGHRRRVEALATTLPRASVATARDALREAQVVVSAISDVDAPFGAADFRDRAIVCDVSVPASVRRVTLAARRDLFVFKGGLARIPGDVDLRIASYPLPGAQAFGCLAEALLLGLENVDTDEFTGPVTVDKVARTRRWAEKHGFSLVDVKRSCVLASEGPR